MAGNQYPHLFKGANAQPAHEQRNEAADRAAAVAPNFLPLIKSEDSKHKSTVIDEALTKKLGRDALLRLKAMEYTLEFLGGRTVASPETIDTLYTIFYNKITNGTTKTRQTVR